LSKFSDRELAKFAGERHLKELVPEGKRNSTMVHFHLEGHFGATRLHSKIWNAGLYWPSLMKDCVKLVSSCIPCARFNVRAAGFNPLRSISATFPFDHVAIDLLFLKTTPRGNNCALILVDVASKFCLLRALMDKKASTIAWALWKIYCDFGIPKIVQSDNGSEFSNAIMTAMKELLGIDHRLVTPYNPRANGLAERFVRTAKTALLKMIDGNITDWDLSLPSCQRSLN
jgi:transposase InsO family protein